MYIDSNPPIYRQNLERKSEIKRLLKHYGKTFGVNHIKCAVGSYLFPHQVNFNGESNYISHVIYSTSNKHLGYSENPNDTVVIDAKVHSFQLEIVRINNQSFTLYRRVS